MRTFLFALIGALCAQSAAFVAVRAPQQQLAAAAASSLSADAAAPARTSLVVMGTGRGASRNKKAKAACRKMKSSRSAAKRFSVTSTGKLLRRQAGKAHLLRKKGPQRKQRLRRVGQCNDAELDTYQRLLLVFPKKK